MAMTFRIEDRGNGVKWVQIDSPRIKDMAQWCRETGCGKQVNFKQISFCDEAELTMFLMKWQYDSNMR
jgi:hypothetical protein